ncbi:S-adenosylmethionine:tRNA ribosyltransferase-isomerase [Litorimonas taeanensis]|uniref:S-adenosylmethionine:tRNA ribosyltransferase-isomerase n=1 Tax=Litorimonas taeanensis TaxID=568099 RepID=A0A420WKR2_9PROT|nr:tRNA preQ1(34) S-adenosylmethionine ribosyltransferase-isomerase QueA [Litorimonas taeanensis]RKQ71590.1 S-adenosylmethionine:tRNA ribosyltransferase-isomerase [Litorimonas taeanensis]
MDVSLFDFTLPEAAIALRPSVPRDSAKLLHVSAAGEFSDHRVSDLATLLNAGDVLVLNETKVFSAALKGVRPARSHGGGGAVTVDVNLHTPETDMTWRAFVRPAKRVREGDVLTFSDELKGVISDKREGGDVAITFECEGDLMASIDAAGEPPLPPYIARKRKPDAQDVEDYQTVYAQEAGSVAAPTAGLHFTPEVFQSLSDKGVELARLILHVGAGTFLPVKSEDTSAHKMHSERYTISDSTAAQINKAKAEGRRIVAVGTTSLRALESSVDEVGKVQSGSAETEIFLTPGSDFKVIDGLMTNFHLPKSTLFMLVSAIAGLDRMQSAYAYAIENNYRFYSYGDSSLIWKAD